MHHLQCIVMQERLVFQIIASERLQSQTLASEIHYLHSGLAPSRSVFDTHTHACMHTHTHYTRTHRHRYTHFTYTPTHKCFTKLCMQIS